jgi:hypothetical protein
MTLVNQCMGLKSATVEVDGTMRAFLVAPDLASARALARTLAR